MHLSTIISNNDETHCLRSMVMIPRLRDGGGLYLLYLYCVYQHSNNNYNGKLQPFAKRLRSDMTKAEACLWKYALCKRQMKGYMFRKQRPILNYIADFICLDLKLAIEVDGITHHFPEVIANDKIRQEALEQVGYKVLRLKDGEVLSHMSNVIENIRLAIEDIEQGQ